MKIKDEAAQGVSQAAKTDSKHSRFKLVCLCFSRDQPWGTVCNSAIASIYCRAANYGHLIRIMECLKSNRHNRSSLHLHFQVPTLNVLGLYIRNLHSVFFDSESSPCSLINLISGLKPMIHHNILTHNQ